MFSNKTAIFALLAFVFAAQLQLGDSLQCVICISTKDGKCDTDPRSLKAQECPAIIPPTPSTETPDSTTTSTEKPTTTSTEKSTTTSTTTTEKPTNKTTTATNSSKADGDNVPFHYTNHLQFRRAAIDRAADQKCMKIVYTKDNKQIVARGCIPASLTCDEVKTNKNVSACNICDTDGCNSSSTITHSLTSMLLLLGGAFYLTR